MAWPWLNILLRNVPWGELVRRTPDIIEASGKLLDKGKPKRQSGVGTKVEAEHETSNIDVLNDKIQQLESHSEAHAKVIAEMVVQLQGLTDALQVLAARNRLLLWVAAALTVVLVLHVALSI